MHLIVACLVPPLCQDQSVSYGSSYLNPWAHLHPFPDYPSIIHHPSQMYLTSSFPLSASPQAVYVLSFSLPSKKNHCQ